MNKTFKTILALAIGAVAMTFASCSSDDEVSNVPSQKEIETKIIGKWKSTTTDGKEIPTNQCGVYTFAQNGVCLHSMSKIEPGEKKWIWANKNEAAYSTANNKMNITITNNVKRSITFNITVDNIDEYLMSWTMGSIIVDGADIKLGNKTVLKKVTADYSNDIIGMWEGVDMTGYETYGDAHHRIEYRADGTYTYYNWDDATQKWMPLEDVFDEWNVDGDWLATRWQNNDSDVMNYEWWDIDYIKDGMMKWSALREKEDGTRFNTTFTWKKIK